MTVIVKHDADSTPTPEKENHIKYLCQLSPERQSAGSAWYDTYMKVSLIAAMTADGFIARHQTDRSFDWTSLEDKQFYVESIKRAGVVVMGSQTFQTFTRYPKGLKFVIYTRQPEKFTNPKPEVITTWPTVVSPQEVVDQLRQEKYSEVAICGGSSIYSMWIESGLVTDVYLTIEPVFFGQGISLFKQAYSQMLLLKEHRLLNESTQMVHYELLPRSVLA